MDAKIPMLLGNNILKPYEAQINLFSTGGGVLGLKEEEIALVETDAGHYTIRVSDLGKLCKMTECFECELCDSAFSNEASLKNHVRSHHEEPVNKFECNVCGKMYKCSTGRSIHMERKHGVSDKSSYLTYSYEKCEDAFKSKNGLKFHVEAKHTTSKTLKSAMKTERKKKTFMDDIKKDIEGDATAEQINTDLNTLMNGSPSIREENMIKVMRKIAIMKVVDHSDK